MPVKLHRCTVKWIKGPHPCWRVQKALDEAGVPYEIVWHKPFRGQRHALQEQMGQRVLPVIEYEDGRMEREETKDLVARIRAGELS
jgi:glutathione S-transferase-like protein